MTAPDSLARLAEVIAERDARKVRKPRAAPAQPDPDSESGEAA